MIKRRKPLLKEEALNRLESLCSRSEQCEFDLIRKLINWGLHGDDRKEIIENLRENKFVDDKRFARCYANDKARFSAWGPYKIKFELIKRKIMQPYISAALSNVPNDVWKEGILRCAAVKSRNLNLMGEEGYEDRQKLFKYLISRGYPSASASKVVSIMKKKQEEGL